MTADEIKRLLGMTPHAEGGCYVRTYRSDEMIGAEALPSRYGGARRTGTVIYYLLEAGVFSEMHRLRSDETYHFYLGDPVEMLHLGPDGSGKRLLLGNDLNAGLRPQAVVPHGVWQGSRLVAGGRVALMGCTVSPGFEYEDYERGSREELKKQYPQWTEMIEELTRE